MKFMRYISSCLIVGLCAIGSMYAGVADTISSPFVLIPLQTNSILQNVKSTARASTARATKAEQASLTLPFFDDFSYSGVYPDGNKWQDRNVFVNNSFAFYPPTYGVATFDALNEKGEVYSQAYLGRAFSADTLSSNTIRLDSVFYPEPKALGIEDSIILSFYYQPGGGWGSLWDGNRRGNPLASDDLLLLEFYSEELGMWIKMWSSDGTSLEEFCPLLNDSTNVPIEQINFFRRVDIPINMLGFNKPNFRFRFRAYSTVNVDLKTGGGQWHIDYVYLNYGRTQNDDINDVAFVKIDESLTLPYTSIPIRQFDTKYLKTSFGVDMTNIGSQALSCRYQYTLRTEGDTTVLYAQPEAGEANANIYPFSSNGYRTDPDLSSMPFGYTLPELGTAQDKYTYRVEHIVKSGIQQDFNTQNDTIGFTQSFSDEFAYDDGSAESGIGLTYEEGAMVYRLDIKERDTLTAARIFFNTSYAEANNASFKLIALEAVEDSRNPGEYIPGRLLIESDVMRPKLGNGLNTFSTYNFNEGGIILSPGVYFVGIKQISETYLNIGFDQNTDASKYTYYYYWDSDIHQWYWKPMFYTGSIMLRPAFGTSALDVSNEVEPTELQSSSNYFRCKVYPNPAMGGDITIEMPTDWNTNDTRYILCDIAGIVVREGKSKSSFSTNGLNAGVYILKLYNKSSGKQAWAKVIIKP